MVLYNEASAEDQQLYSGKEGKRDTALHRILKKSGGEHEKIDELIKNNPSIINLATENSKRTPLHICAAPPTILNSFGFNETAQKLIDLGADLNAIDEDGNTPLHLAVSAGRIEIVEALVKAGADITIKNKEGKLPKDLATDREISAFFSETLKEKAEVASNEPAQNVSFPLLRKVATKFMAAFTGTPSSTPSTPRRSNSSGHQR